MPCGTGKSLVSHWIAQSIFHFDKESDDDADRSVICIAVPSLYLLSQIYNTWVNEYDNCYYLLVGSDAEVRETNTTGLVLTTSTEKMKKFFDKHTNM